MELTKICILPFAGPTQKAMVVAVDISFRPSILWRWCTHNLLSGYKGTTTELLLYRFEDVFNDGYEMLGDVVAHIFRSLLTRRRS